MVAVVTHLKIPPRNGEGDRTSGTHSVTGDVVEGMKYASLVFTIPSTMLRMVPLPVPGRNFRES